MSSSPDPKPPKDDSELRGRWHAFLLFETSFLSIWGFVTLAAFKSSVFHQVQWVLVGIFGVWLCLSVAVMYLLVLGHPLVMRLVPYFGPSPQERAYQRTVGARPVLTDKEFYARFYAGSDIPEYIPAKVRSCLAYVDVLIERAHPEDMIAFAFDDLDWCGVVWRIEKTFEIQFTKQDRSRFTGTLGNLIELVHVRLQ